MERNRDPAAHLLDELQAWVTPSTARLLQSSTRYAPPRSAATADATVSTHFRAALAEASRYLSPVARECHHCWTRPIPRRSRTASLAFNCCRIGRTTVPLSAAWDCANRECRGYGRAQQFVNDQRD